MPGGEARIVLESVSARYPSSREPPLAGISLTARAGELFAILGPNGAGKSTLLRVLSGMLAPSTGTALLEGVPLARLSRLEIARRIAVVAQVEEIAFGYTVADVVAMGRSAHQDVWMRSRAEDRAIVARVMARCDIEHLAGRVVSELSGGEQKRVAFARALAQAPRVMLLDEPTAFLDVRHQIALFEVLADEVRAGLACVVVMHDLNLAAQYASKVALLKAGHLVAVGTIEEVMTYARLRETFDSDLYVGVNEVTGSRFFVPMRGPANA